MAQKAQKAHKAMRLSLPPEVHDWLWERRRKTGRPMHELAIEAIRNNMQMKASEVLRASPLDGGAAVARADKVRNLGSPPALHAEFNPQPKTVKAKKKRKGLR